MNKMIKYLMIGTFFLLLLSNRFFAQNTPVIESIEGKVSVGNSIYIYGSNFSNNGNEIPHKFDDFESGTLGTSLSNGGWKTWASLSPNPTNSPPVYTQVRSHSGNQCGYADISDDGDCLAYIDNFDSNIIYMSHWLYFVIHGDPRTVKAYRPNSGDGKDLLHAYPQIKDQEIHKSSHRLTIEKNSGDSNSSTSLESPTKLDAGRWYRVEYYYEHSEPGFANGLVQYWKDLNQEVDYIGITRNAGVTAKFETILLPFFSGNGGGIEFWYDDVYISKTQARVEIGDSESWYTNTHREIQNPIAWSNSAIEVKFNRGTFNIGTKVYLFVVDNDGNVNINGFPIVIGGESTGPQRPIMRGIKP
jgi:hypothetical protein